MFKDPAVGERVCLLHINLGKNKHAIADENEFQELAISAGAELITNVRVSRSYPDASYFLGKGKVDELHKIIINQEINLVLCDHCLTPTQQRNLERKWSCRVLDRTELILDIFSQRARTYEGKLQVELAQLRHLATRLVRGWTHLERQKGGIGLRGPGETQLELDRRLIGGRISYLKNRLEKVRLQRGISRKSREKAAIPTVTLIGYTNAGKSTLFNKITNSKVLATDQLFATLDPTLRHCKLAEIGKIIVADTVGFIRNLPHKLIEAFKATLEEIKQSSLLIHVVDRSDPQWREHFSNVHEVLKQIQADNIQELIVFNKIDLVGIPAGFEENKDKPNRVFLSAKLCHGLEYLEQAITKALNHVMIKGTITLAATEYIFRAKLYQFEAIEKELIDDKGNWILQVSFSKHIWHRLYKETPDDSKKFLSTLVS